MDELDDFKVCHCVSKDCSKCPMRNTGTGSLKHIYKQFETKEQKGIESNADQNIEQREKV